MHKLTVKKAQPFTLPQVTKTEIDLFVSRGVITKEQAKELKPFGPQLVSPGESVILTDEQATVLALGYASTAIYIEGGLIELEEVAA